MELRITTTTTNTITTTSNNNTIAQYSEATF